MSLRRLGSESPNAHQRQQHSLESGSAHLGPTSPPPSWSNGHKAGAGGSDPIAAVGGNGVLSEPKLLFRKGSYKRTGTFRLGGIYMILLALQVGLQPIFSRLCVSPSVVLTSQVIACEVVKVALALVLMHGDGTLAAEARRYSPLGALTCSALPAAIYAVQNTLVQVAYRHLDYLTFSLLNQTKLLFTALFAYTFLGQKQSRPQIGALVAMLGAASLLSAAQSRARAGATRAEELDAEGRFYLGVLPVMAASVLSGLASAACQWAAQVRQRSTYLMTAEMSTIATCLLFASLASSPDGATIRKLGFFHGWTPWSATPVVTNALGGIIVGLVTKHSGGVKKGFSVIAALAVTAMVQFVLEGRGPSYHVYMALPLVVGGIVVHSRYPYKGTGRGKKHDS